MKAPPSSSGLATLSCRAGTRLIAAAGVLLSLAACGREAGSAAKDKPEVALIMKSLADEFFQTMARGAEAYQAERDGEFTLVIEGIRSETDLDQQVALVEQMVARGVDAIVIAPADSKALVPALKRAREAGVVVTIDSKLDAGILAEAGVEIPFVGPDNRDDSMALGAAAAVKAAGREGQVQVVGFDAISAARELVAEGRILATADPQADRLAAYGIAAALEMLSGEAAPEDRKTPVDLVTREAL